MYLFFRKKRKLILFLLLPYTLLIGSLIIPINYAITAPGNLSKLDDQIEIINRDNSYEINTVYVITLPKVTIFQAIISQFYDYLELNKLNKNEVSSRDSFKSGQVSEMLSYQYAVIQAYTAASLKNAEIEIDYTLKGYVISYRASHQKQIEIGDIIISVDGVSFTNESYDSFLTPFKIKNEVVVNVIRNDHVLELNLVKNSTFGSYGLYLEPIYNINSTPEFITNYQNDYIGGPSGGLMQSLYIYCLLLNIDLKGLQIAGTGTINSLGVVGKIGGIEQKIVTAYRNKNINVFYVGKENYMQAKKIYDQLKGPSFSLVEVGEFNEMVIDLLQRI